MSFARTCFGSRRWLQIKKLKVARNEISGNRENSDESTQQNKEPTRKVVRSIVHQSLAGRIINKCHTNVGATIPDADGPKGEKETDIAHETLKMKYKMTQI